MFFVALFLIISAIGWQKLDTAKAGNQTFKIESTVTLEAKGRGGTNVNFADGATIQTEYSAELDFSQAEPLALTAADFDGDGVDDLASSYATSTGGLLTIHRGNIDSIFPGASETTPPPFFPTAKTFATLEPPDFLVTGDFNNDGRQDVVTAKRDADALWFLKGDGMGNLLAAERISLPGKVTALAAGELNRKDSLKDLAVGIVAADEAKVLIFEGWNGALSSPPAGLSEPRAAADGHRPSAATDGSNKSDGPEVESFHLPNAATSLAFVSLTENGFGDLAIAAGKEIIIVTGRDRQLTLFKEKRREAEAVISRQTLDAEIVAMTAGRFTDGSTSEIVALTDDGSLFVVAQKRAGAVQKASQINLQVSNGGLPPLTVTNLQAGRNVLVTGRVSASAAADDLILLDEAGSKIHFLKTPPEGGTQNAFRLAASFDGKPIAAVPMRLNKDGLDDIVFLSADQIAPSVALTAPTAIFTVNSMGNGGDSNTADGVCNDGTGACTLRAAVQQANASNGADEIRFNLPGTAPFTLAPAPLGISEPFDTVTIDATTQPGFTNAPIVEIDGSSVQQGFLSNGFNFTRTFSNPIKFSSNSVLRGFVINRHKDAGVRSVDQNVREIRIEGCYIGTDVTGTIARPNGTVGSTAASGVLMTGTVHRIGGTVARAKNVISGNNGHGIHLPNNFPTLSTLIAGNFIGTDVTGTVDLGNLGDGIRTNGGTMTVGETFAEVRNVISGNGGDGINISLTGLTIQNNRVGTSADGNTDLGNDGVGVRVAGTFSSTIGGTAANTRNIISGNGRDGILLNNTDTIRIQGNFIGTKADGLSLMPNDRHGIFLTNFTAGSSIGGDTVTPGTCDGPCNIVGFGSNGKVVSITNANPSGLTERNSRIKVGQSSHSPESPDGFANAINLLLMLGNNILPSNNEPLVDLGDDGRTPNDPIDGDNTGPNHLKNFNETTQVTTQGNNTTVQNTLHTNPGSTNTVDFYLNRANGTSTHIGSETVTVNGNGDASFSRSFPVQAQPGDKIFTVTTDSTTRDSSETSPPVSIGGQNCTYTVNPVGFIVPRVGGIGFGVEIETQAGCAWQAGENETFITGLSPTSGIGPGRVTFDVLENFATPRRGEVTVAGQIVNVEQAGNCDFTVTPIPNPPNFPVEGGNGQVRIETAPLCDWSVENDGAFVTNITPVSGRGPATVAYHVPSNDGGFRQDFLTFILEGNPRQLVTVRQDTCTYTFTPENIFFPSAGHSNGRTGRMETNAQTCQWGATVSAPFQVSPSSGVGTRSFTVRVPPNRSRETINGFVNFTAPRATILRVLGLNQPHKNAGFDYDADGNADFGIFSFLFGSNSSPIASRDATTSGRGSSALAQASWRIINSSNGTLRTDVFGLDTDKIVPGDYNGDGRADLAVWRPSDQTWYVARPTGVPAENLDATQFGLETDIPVQADYDGDGRTDIAVFRPSAGDWRILQSTDSQVRVVHFNSSSARLLPADYDGDGHADLALWRPLDSTWRIMQSSDDSIRIVQLGLPADKPVPADYDGDFMADVATFRPSDGVWRILQSANNSVLEISLGSADDVPVPADYDGDLKTDAAVWRPGTGTWLILRSSDGIQQTRSLGAAGDVPVPSALFPVTLTSPGVEISGRVTSPDGLGLRNAILSITDAHGVRRTATTSSFGFYILRDVAVGETVTIGVTSKRYRFAARAVPVFGSLTDVNFVGLE